MIKNFSKIVKIIAMGALVAIPVVNFTLPNSIPKDVTHVYKENIYEITEAEETTEVHVNSTKMESAKRNGSTQNTEETTIEANFTILESAEEDGNPEYDFCREFKSKGMFIKRDDTERRPELLKEVSEIDIADDSIFFVETSCAEDLNSRQSCAIESAARANPEKQIYVLLISPEASEGSDGEHNIGKLKSIYENINVYYIDIFSYTERTKLEKWVANQTLMTSSFKVAHLSDGLRLLTLYKYGGIYLDMDVVVLHSLQNMSNFVGDEGYGEPASGVMSMKANGTLVNACLDEFVNDYHGDLWSHNGPQAIARALNNKCERKTTNLWENCDGTFIVYPKTVFYPIPWHQWQLYFEETDDDKIDEIVINSMAIHVWNKLSSKRFVKVGSNTLYGVLASKYCPLSYWNSGTFF